MLKTEISQLMNENGRVFEWATKVDKGLNLNAEDKEISQVIDAWAKQIGERGVDSNNELAEYIVKTVSPEVYDVPDQLLDSMFNRGSIAEFDDFQITTTPKNTLAAREAGKAGTVDKSYLDFSNVKPTYKHLQIETELKYSDLRRNGFKTIATMTTFAEEALKNKMFYTIFSAIDAILASGEQVIDVAATTPSETAIDKLALYLIDRDPNAFTVSLSKYAQAIAKMSGYKEYMLSDQMKNEYNRYGLTQFYQGVKIGSISSAHKTGDGQLLLPDKRIFGIAGKIGDLDMRGDLRAYETMDNKREVIELKISGFEFGWAFNDLEKIAKVTLQ